MNNIYILEDFLDYYSYLKTAIGGDDIREFEIRISKNELKAISNLIAENKELKENYIPKSKIKAKIEEVEQWELYNMKIPKLSTLDERLGAKIGIKYVLQELLGKE